MNPMRFKAEPNSFAGRGILITGATSGIGRSLALGIAQLGATVLLLGRDVAALETLFDEIKASDYPEPGIVPFDLSQEDPERLNALKQVISERYGALHGLIHNAAILGDRVPFEHYKMTTWAQVFRTNFEAPVAMTQALLPLLQQLLRLLAQGNSANLLQQLAGQSLRWDEGSARRRDKGKMKKRKQKQKKIKMRLTKLLKNSHLKKRKSQ